MSLELQYQLKQWCAWLPPELRSSSSSGWKNGGLLPGQTPDVSFLPLMQRRRLSPMARAALAVAWPCLEGINAIPAICASLHGETHYCFPILNTLAESADVSPTEFTLSVHGAVGALLSQYARNRAPYVALAPGAEGYSAALVEAFWFIRNQEKQVLVLLYEQPLPPVYHAYAANPPGVMALAMRLEAGNDEGMLLTIKREGEKISGEMKDPLLSIILALCCKGQEVLLPGRLGAWRWLFADSQSSEISVNAI
ncbi:MAG: hypothetical protein AXA67_08340 [Methylothermaceae bacteria B42]|nr:MAG: hypothetical protein AXA67_08340 [Methylothermaceae bacteria B42]HHJ40457.1 3-oxoacyl-ACP synthase [Methylothermaceae bacterium]